MRTTVVMTGSRLGGRGRRAPVPGQESQMRKILLLVGLEVARRVLKKVLRV